MRLLFVSSVTVGGSGRSQRELAARLRSRGHEVLFVADDGQPARAARWLYGHLSDLAARLEGRPGSRLADWAEKQPGRRSSSCEIGGLPHRTSAVAQNALLLQIEKFRPDVVVANSVDRLAWRRVHRTCEQRSIPTVLYVREVDSLDHFVHGEVPQLLVANAESLQAALRERGHECSFVPSVIDMTVTATESTRRVALAINPIPDKGSDIVWAIAERAPEIPIVVQEAWPLDADDLAEVERRAADLENVSFRRAIPPGPAIYADARVLLVPYRVDSRPRVIAEAQANGIPVIAAEVPALREAIGDGGAVVAVDDVDAWVCELRSFWSDDARYERIAAAAVAHSKRPAMDPELVAASFEALVAGLFRSEG